MVIRPAWIETSAPKASSLGSDTTCGAVQAPPAGRIEAWTRLSRPVVDTCHTATALPSRSMATRGDSAASAGTEIVSESPKPPYLGRKAARIDSALSSTSRQTATTSPEPSETSCGSEPDWCVGEMVSGLSSPAPLWGKAKIRRTVPSAASSRGRMRFMVPPCRSCAPPHQSWLEGASGSMDGRWKRDVISTLLGRLDPMSVRRAPHMPLTCGSCTRRLRLDVLVQPEHVFRVPLALERDEPVVLRVAVDRARHVRAHLGDVVHVTPVRGERRQVGQRLAAPRAALLVELGVVPHRFRGQPGRGLSTGEGRSVLGHVRDPAAPRPDGEAAFGAVGRARGVLDAEVDHLVGQRGQERALHVEAVAPVLRLVVQMLGLEVGHRLD